MRSATVSDVKRLRELIDGDGLAPKPAVTRILDELSPYAAVPSPVRVDNGLEFTAPDLRRFAQSNVTIHYIQP